MGMIEPALRFVSQCLRTTWLHRPEMLQVAALCYRMTDAGHEILLVTSRGRGNWILPKGWPKKAVSSAQTALEEAFEEAGVKGHVCETPMGSFHYDKSTKGELVLRCQASVYAIKVVEICDEFPEKGDRQIIWATPEKAAKMVCEPELAKFLLRFKLPDQA